MALCLSFASCRMGIIILPCLRMVFILFVRCSEISSCKGLEKYKVLPERDLSLKVL